MMASPFISLRQAAIGYLNQPVLTGIDLEIQKGQHWAFIGESGSGKTSLLNAIAGNLQLKKGEIIRYFNIQNSTANTGADYHKSIAFVASKHHFRNLSNTADFYYQQRFNSSDSDDAMTVKDYLENVSASVNTHYWDLHNTTALLKLTALLDKQLIKLSNGETKRLMIAAALLKNPLLLLLDNPLTGLDIQTRAEFNEILGKIAGAGITIVMATSPDEIPAMITRVAILQSGVLKQMPVNEFNPGNFKVKNTAHFNTDLAGLLDHYPASAYRKIVGMNNVNIKYGDKVILKNINWQIKQGERWALLGHNGAGKSTLLSLINGDNPQAYANDIVLFDKKRGSGESIWDIKKKTGFISPELYQYFPSESTCLQAVESGYYDTIGLFKPSDKAKADRAMQWLKVLKIDRYARQLLKNIPASAQRLCLLARAMIKNPALLILDEPCQGMDDHQIHHFKSLIDVICSSTNITLIYVTHYTQHIPDSVQQALKLEAGMVIS